MAINFPASPTTNQTYTYNGRTWTWNGVGWQATGSTGLTVYTKTDFTATAGQTSFSATYTVGFVDVYYNGSKLSTSEYTATTGSTVVLGTACAVGDIVETVAWTISSSFNPSLGSASATSLAIGGATIGTNALAVTGTTIHTGAVAITGATTSTSLALGGATLGSNALAVTGTSQFNGSVTTTGRITQSLSPVSAEYALRSTGQTTGWIAIDMANTGGDYIIAGENSTGNNLIAGDSAYDMCVRGPSGIAFSANAGASQQMRLTSAGNLGLGVTPSTSNAGYPALELVGGGILYSNATSNDFRMGCNLYISGGVNTYKTTNPVSMYYQTGGQHIWYTAPSGTAGTTATLSRAFAVVPSPGISGTGCIVVGDTTPAGTLYPGRIYFNDSNAGYQGIIVNYSAANPSNSSVFTAPGGSGIYSSDSSTASNQCWRFFNPNGNVGGITISGTTSTFNTTSDERLKNFDVPQRDFKSIIQTIMVKDGEFLTAPGDRMLMISAQQTAEIGYVDAVEYPQDKKEHDEQPQNIYWSADYARLAPLALWGVKDLYAENEALKATVADLVARLAALEAK